ncbi:MAG TPA: glycosyltransferase [Solirubrobacteraceae bacterium]|nr:glycosyltransferase [Solirubrobacteraceae bacterium]
MPVSPRRIVMTSYGFRDSGGGTLLPRTIAYELVRRGWEVTVFYAGVGRGGSGRPYEIVRGEDQGVRLVGVFNREHHLLDLGNPLREVDDPPITAAFAQVLDEVRPDVVHFHNLHNLGAALLDEAASRGIRSYYTAHNHWLGCARGYLLDGGSELCAGPGRGGDCAACAGGDRAGYEYRTSELRARVSRAVTALLAPSEAVRHTLVGFGYPEAAVDVLPQVMPAAERVWEALGRDRAPGRVGDPLTIGFFGSVFGMKGVHLLVEAVQLVDAEVRVAIHGEIVHERYAEHLAQLDRRGVVEVHGSFGHDGLVERLAAVDVSAFPSIWWENQGLVAAESLAARVPVLVPHLGGLAEQARDGVDGLHFEGRSARSLAEAIQRLATEPGLLEALQGGIEPPASFTGHVDDLEAYYRGERPGRERPRPAARPAVRWIGDHTLKTSLSIVNQEVTARLEDAVVQRVERSGLSTDAPLPHLAHVEVRHQWPPDLRPAPAGRLAVIQPWEFGAIPRDWLGPIAENVDELWVPSDFVRAMYLDAGVDPDRVHTVPNGVDLERMRPDGARLELDAPGLRLLFVGGLIGRKGPDVLLDAYRAAFAGRDDVTLVIKDFGANGVYAGADREGLRAYAASGALPRVLLLDDELSADDMAALYRACDVLVHPYRGEGFAMPVLEAMACGLPVVTTAGGPTDEFCPPEAGWRIRSSRRVIPGGRIDHLVTAGDPWMLEPDAAHLAELLRAVAADPAERGRRGRAAAEAARALSWDAVAAGYRERIDTLLTRPPRNAAPRAAALELEGEATVRVLATPAWRGEHRLGELLTAWAQAAPVGADACLHLLGDSRVDGTPDELAEAVMDAAAAAGVDLDEVADIDLLVRPLEAGDDDRLLHAAVHAYVPLHDACDGQVRHARAAGNAVVALDALAVWPMLARAVAQPA